LREATHFPFSSDEGIARQAAKPQREAKQEVVLSGRRRRIAIVSPQHQPVTAPRTADGWPYNRRRYEHT